MTETCTNCGAIIPHTRHRLPTTRTGQLHKFDIAGTEGYLITGEFPTGELGEVFITIAKEGATLSGVLDALAITTSIGLQYGVPLRSLVTKFIHTNFEPQGFTPNPEIQRASSIIDYIYRWLGLKYLPPEDIEELNLRPSNANHD